IVYAAARHALLGAVTSGAAGGRYGLSGPGASAGNAGLLLGAAFYFGNTLDIFVSHSVWRILAAGLVSGGALAAAAGGIIRAGRGERNTAFAALILLAAGLIPVVLISRVSELYAFSCTPFFSVLAGSMLISALRSAQQSGSALKRAALVSFIAVYVAVGEYSLIGKMGIAREHDAMNAYYIAVIDAFSGSEEPRLCIGESEIMNRERAYSTLIQTDIAALRYYASFVEEVRGIRMEVSETGSSDCFVSISKRSGRGAPSSR
ncbi:MAG: hypothetical protein PHQ19_09275, partial [Candidatus Krumholzibacteria bacterium]|nr:hypothetical protein [Candidatus Krumholzibacteria bacterium]